MLCLGLRGLWVLGGCCLCSCTEGSLQFLICPPSPILGCPLWPRRLLCPSSLASCTSIGLCSSSTLPRSPQAGSLAAGNHYCQQECSTGVTVDLVDPHFLLLGPSWGPHLLLARFSHYLFLSLFFPLNEYIIFSLLYPCLLVLF